MATANFVIKASHGKELWHRRQANDLTLTARKLSGKNGGTEGRQAISP